MGIGNILVLSQVTAFLLSFILSFFIFIPLTINQNEFDGHCLLYGKGEWNSNATGGSELFSVEWGPKSACGFSVFMGIVIMMLSVFYMVLEAIYLARETDSSWLEAFITTIVTLVVTLMLFAASLTISVGFATWCDLITDPASQIASCEIADFINFARGFGDIDSSNFYTEIKMAEFGSWSCLLCWLFLLVTSVVKIIKFREHESFMSSMHRERQKLLQKVGHNPQYAV